MDDPTHARPRPAASVAPRAREQRPPIRAGVAALSGPCGGAVGAMSRHRRVARRQPGGAAGGSAAAAAVRARAEALREVGVDEEVEMAVQLALERFRSGDEAGARRGPARPGATLRVSGGRWQRVREGILPLCPALVRHSWGAVSSSGLLSTETGSYWSGSSQGHR